MRLRHELKKFRPAIASVTKWKVIRQSFFVKSPPTITNVDPTEIEGTFLDFLKVRQNEEETNKIHLVAFLKDRLPFKKGKEVDVVLEYLQGLHLIDSDKFLPCKVRRVPRARARIDAVACTVFEVPDICHHDYF
jgi:hypothetical protein